MKKASELIQSFYSQLQINDSKGYGSFFSSWDTIVGMDLSCHCKPGNLKKGLLIIYVDHPGWHQKFLLSEKRILGELKHRFPDLEIRRLAYQYQENLEIIEKPAISAEVIKLDKTEENVENQEPKPILPENMPDDVKDGLERLRKLLKDRS